MVDGAPSFSVRFAGGRSVVAATAKRRRAQVVEQPQLASAGCDPLKRCDWGRTPSHSELLQGVAGVELKRRGRGDRRYTLIASHTCLVVV